MTYHFDPQAVQLRAAPSNPILPIQLISGDDLATLLLYSGTTSAFRTWCTDLGITPVPGRRDIYDPVLVRQRLDEAQRLNTPANLDQPTSLVEQRRQRRGE
ncbi:MAG: hypothetical protein ACU0FH_20480 [Heliomarina sp.]|uniref:hypothetical protein n=1 Tax=Heliomarina sp. TaxID=2917556 RepID=UPI004059D0EB